MKHDYNARIDAATIATSTIGIAQAHRYGGSGTVQMVVAEQEGAADAEWDVLINGSSVFGSTQSVSGSDTPEEFQPSQNTHFAGASVQVQLDVTASSGTAGSLVVGVLTDDGRGPGEY